MGKQTATDAVTTGAALVVAKLANWLQQPAQSLRDQSSLDVELWRLFTQFIRGVLLEHLSAVSNTTDKLLHQLVASGELHKEVLAKSHVPGCA
jgi:hypothetical protein